MRIVPYVLALLLCIVVVSGCATGSYILTGTQRPPTKAETVKLYTAPPAEYEVIGVVEAASDVEILRQAAQDRATTKLKELAAKIGANGILLLDAGTEKGMLVGSTSGNFFWAAPIETKKISGKAIYVTKE